MSILSLYEMYDNWNETEMVKLSIRFSSSIKINMMNRVLSDQEREEKYGSRRKRFRENPRSEENLEVCKYLIDEEKLLIEDIAHAFYQSRA